MATSVRKKSVYDPDVELKQSWGKTLKYDNNRAIKDVVLSAAKRGNIDPALLLSSSWQEGMNKAVLDPDGISLAYENALKKDKDLNAYPVDGFWNYGLDTFGNNLPKLKKYLPEGFDKSYRLFEAFNEKGEKMQTAAFKTNEDALVAKAAFMNMERDNVLGYAKKKGLDLNGDTEALNYFTLASYNGGFGNAQKMLDEYSVAKDRKAFISQGLTTRQGVQKNIAPRLKRMQLSSELLSMENGGRIPSFEEGGELTVDDGGDPPTGRTSGREASAKKKITYKPEELFEFRDSQKIKSGKYPIKHLDGVVKAAKAVGVDPYWAVSMVIQESSLGMDGKRNIGYMKEDLTEAQMKDLINFSTKTGLDGQYLKPMIALRDKLKYAKDLGYKDAAFQLQAYNGLGILTKKMANADKAYGVEIGNGIDMRKNPIYGKRLLALAEDLKRDPRIKKYIETGSFEKGGRIEYGLGTEDPIMPIKAPITSVDVPQQLSTTELLEQSYDNLSKLGTNASGSPITEHLARATSQSLIDSQKTVDELDKTEMYSSAAFTAMNAFLNKNNSAKQERIDLRKAIMGEQSAQFINPYAEGTGSQAIMEKGGEIPGDGLGIKTIDGGKSKVISTSDHSNPMIEFEGRDHDNGGIGIEYAGKVAEVENKEVGWVDKQGGLNIFGKLKVPGTNQTFRKLAKDTAKEEAKIDGSKSKYLKILNESNPADPYQATANATAKVMFKSLDKQSKDIAEKKEALASYQSLILSMTNQNKI